MAVRFCVVRQVVLERFYCTEGYTHRKKTNTITVQDGHHARLFQCYRITRSNSEGSQSSFYGNCGRIEVGFGALRRKRQSSNFG